MSSCKLSLFSGQTFWWNFCENGMEKMFGSARICRYKCLDFQQIRNLGIIITFGVLIPSVWSIRIETPRVFQKH